MLSISRDKLDFLGSRYQFNQNKAKEWEKVTVPFSSFVKRETKWMIIFIINITTIIVWNYYNTKLRKNPTKMYCFTGTALGNSVIPYKIELRREIISQSEYKELWGGIRVIFNLNPVIFSYIRLECWGRRN